MARRKKKNNIITKKGNYYYRCHWYNEFGRQVETTIPLNTDNRNRALALGKIVSKHIDDIKSGVIQKYLRFPEQRRLDDFPSLKDYIENRQNMPKNVYLDTKNSDTVYSNIPKLSGSIRN